MLFWILMILLGIAAIAAIASGDSGTLAGLPGDTVAAVLASAALLIFLAGGLSSYAGRWGQALKDVAIWIGLGLVLILGYSFRDDLRPLYDRVAGELMPPGTAVNVASETQTERAIRIRRRPDGHFFVQSSVNGRSVAMLIDTGASKVVLTTDDARAAGIDVNRLNYSVPVQTANGTGFAAAVRLDSVSVGGIRRDGVEALVARPGALRESLLGMNFLSDVRFEMLGDFVVIRG